MRILRHPIVQLVAVVGLAIACVGIGMEAYDAGFPWFDATFLGGVLWAVALHALLPDEEHSH
jgi:hypothetical protein